VTRTHPFFRVATGAAGALALAGASASWWARYRAPYEPVVERIALPLPAAHGDLAGFRIGFVTDPHVGPTFSPKALSSNVAGLAKERLDLLLLGGDYVSESPRYAPGTAGVFAELATGIPNGALAVLGNHDCAVGSWKVTQALESAGIRVLRNEAANVRVGPSSLWIVGIDDALLGTPDLPAAFAAVPPGTPALCLWHEPDLAEQAARAGAFAQLSGHSHGGQLRFPFFGPLVLPPLGRRFVQGMHEAAGMPVYTSRGVGVYRPPVRLRCPPEVTVVTLGP
jgi:predicted MPP superfamily phosphohydrolase